MMVWRLWKKRTAIHCTVMAWGPRELHAEYYTVHPSSGTRSELSRVGIRSGTTNQLPAISHEQWMWGTVQTSTFQRITPLIWAYYFKRRLATKISRVHMSCLLWRQLWIYRISSLGVCWSQWPRGLGHEPSSPALTLGSWVRIPLKVWMCARLFCVVLCVGSGLATGWSPSKESYRLCVD
jgi:hypothetical protein